MLKSSNRVRRNTIKKKNTAAVNCLVCQFEITSITHELLLTRLLAKRTWRRDLRVEDGLLAFVLYVDLRDRVERSRTVGNSTSSMQSSSATDIAVSN